MSPLIGLVGEPVDVHVAEDLVRVVQQTLPHLTSSAPLAPVPKAVNQPRFLY